MTRQQDVLPGTRDNSSDSIAVIGIGCHYPGAENPRKLWENVLARRQEFRLFLDSRLPTSDYSDPDPAAADKIYAMRAAYIDGLNFDWAGRRIPKKAFDNTDIVHWLALEVADHALEDAGYMRGSVPGDRTGVVVGNSLTGEHMRSNTLRLRWPFVRRALISAANARGLAEPIKAELADSMEQVYKSVFPEVTEDTLAGGLSNTIAGRICNYFDLHGGGYVVDGACSSSLLALCTAAGHLTNGDWDLAIAGGVDVSLDPFELVGFAKATALTADEMNVYDRRGAGFIPGEGCGFVVLKRLQDAHAAGDTVYAVVRGWGVSSDGKGGITAPSSQGQAKALSQAYKKAGYSTHELDFIEGHGTGTRVGDRVELQGIAAALEAHGAPAPKTCGVTSFKSIVGHTKAAAGIGAFIKAAIAVNQRILPPTAGCTDPNPAFDEEAQGLYPILQGRIEDKSKRLRAGVSAMGFGGINSHVTLESGDPPSPKFVPELKARTLLASAQQTELLVLGAPSIDDMRRRLRALADTVELLSLGDLTDHAAHLASRLDASSAVRAAVIAGRPDHAAKQIRWLAERLEDGALAERGLLVNPTQDAWVGVGLNKTRLGFLLPGQGSQQVGMARVLVERFDWARDLVERVDTYVQDVIGRTVSPVVYRNRDGLTEEEIQRLEQTLERTEVAQPAICMASVLYARFLEHLGLKPSIVAGHSLGELTAFHLAGGYDEETLFKFAAARGLSMSSGQDQAGGMASLTCSMSKAKELIKATQGYVTIANNNSPEQVVVSGERQAISEVLGAAEREGIDHRILNVSAAFHSRMMTNAVASLKERDELPRGLVGLTTQLLSSVDGQPVASDVDLTAHFCNQISAPVQFTPLVERMADACDLILEVGPGRVLSGLANSTLAQSGGNSLPVASRPDSDRDLNIVLGRAFVYGSDIDWERLYAPRLTRTFVPTAERIFIDNPCERPFPEIQTEKSVFPTDTQGSLESALSEDTDLSVSTLQDYFKRRRGFLADLIKSDLHWSSAVANDVVADEISNRKRVPPKPTKETVVIEQEDKRVENILTDLVVQRTGFPAEAIVPDARLLDDLNLDSIKAGELVAAAAKTFGLAGRLEPAQFANASLRDITEAIVKADGESSKVEERDTSRKAITAVDGHEIEETLIGLATEKTGYPSESVTLELRLLDDLNLDSIKAGELVAAAAKTFGLAGKLEPSRFANASLRDIADAIYAQVSEDPARDIPASTEIEDILIDLVEQQTGYPKLSISLELRLLDDLNLDSIKAGQLIAAAAKLTGVAGKLDPSSLANATLAQILDEIRSARDGELVFSDQTKGLDGITGASLAEANALKQKPPTWVRNFVIDYIPEAREMRGSSPVDWKNSSVLILVPDTDSSMATALNERLVQMGASVDQADLSADGLLDRLPKKSFTHVMSVMPQRIAAYENGLTEILRPLHATIQCAFECGVANVGFVQFGDGRFGTSSDTVACSTVSFARSVSLDHPDWCVRVVDLAAGMETGAAVEAVLSEWSDDDPFKAVGYPDRDTRLVPRVILQQPASYSRRPMPWKEDEVVLVTGGAKGITTECALALAEKTRAKFALVGSSPDPRPGEKNVIVDALTRFSNAGITCRYYSCDLTVASQVQALVTRVRSELGAIQAVVHGAGLNRAKRVEQTNLDEATSEVAPKLLGAKHLCEALADTPPRIFVALTSIIGVTGMTGNAWYAFSNESLDLTLRHFEKLHPDTSVISIAYSVWGEIGMGVRMGVIDHLAEMGMGAIPSDEGVQRFLKLVDCDPNEKQVIITAAAGGLSTWRGLCKPDSPRGTHRFLERIMRMEPGVELVARARLTSQRDAYLLDHDFRGSLLFPTVFGLEAMAQAATHLASDGAATIRRIEDISLRRPIVADAEEGVEIELHAMAEETTATGEQAIRVGIRCEQSGFQSDHFSATLIFGDRNNATPSLASPDHTPLPLDPRTDLYGGLLFQGPLFQRMRAIYSLDSEKAVLGADKTPSGDSGFLIGDPYLRDVYLQSVQLPLAPDIVLPVSIGRLERFSHPDTSDGPRIVNVSVKNSDGQEFNTDVVITDQRGQVVERLTDYRVRIMERYVDGRTALELAGAGTQDEHRVHSKIESAFSELGLKPPALVLEYLPDLHRMGKEKRHVLERPIISRTIEIYDEMNSSISEVDVDWTATGKPTLVGTSTEQIDVSLSHDDHYCLCVVGEGAQGCDLEPVMPRAAEDCIALLGASRETLLEALAEHADPRDRAATRIWSAVESVIKATGIAQEISLSIKEVHGDVIVMEATVFASTLSVLTIPIALTHGSERILSLVIDSKQTEKSSITTARNAESDGFYMQGHGSRFIFDQDRSQYLYEYLYQPAFKDCGNLSRGVFFSSYLLSIGKVRELSMAEIGPQLVAQIATGDWGLVTNWAKLKVYGNAKTYERLVARFRLGKVYGSVIPLHCEFCKVSPDGSLQRIAEVDQETTWVQVIGHGQVVPAEFPSYLSEFTERMGQTRDKVDSISSWLRDKTQVELGAVRYDTAARPIGLPVATSEVFGTTLEDSNLVGNVYYANYFIWQGRLRDRFIHSVAPNLMQGVGDSGEPFCLSSRLDYLRDAMPFDRVQVEMSVATVWECGAKLLFSYYRELSDGSREKLAVGEQKFAWVKGLSGGDVEAVSLPRPIISSLLAKLELPAA